MTDTGQKVRDSLSPKNLRVLEGICAGKTNKEIAAGESTTEQVIKNHVRTILDRTGQSHRTELAIYCFFHGIVKCPCAGISRARSGQAYLETISEDACL